MMAATGKGKNAQPMYYDAKAFHETDVYKNHDKIDAQVKAYLKVKKKKRETKNQRIEGKAQRSFLFIRREIF